MKQLLVMMCVMLLATGYVRAGEDDERVAASRATVKEFMQSLKQELQKGMQDGGPVNALGVCNMTAPGIANTYSARHGWSVGRTSLRVRNPDNAPDIWEQAVLHPTCRSRSRATPGCSTCGRSVSRWDIPLS